MPESIAAIPFAGSNPNVLAMQRSPSAFGHKWSNCLRLNRRVRTANDDCFLASQALFTRRHVVSYSSDSRSFASTL